MNALKPFALNKKSGQYPDFKVPLDKKRKAYETDRVTLLDLGLPVDLPLSPVYRGWSDFDAQLNLFACMSPDYRSRFHNEFEFNYFYVSLLFNKGDREACLSELLSEIQEHGVTEHRLTAYLQSEELLELEAEQAKALIDEFAFLITNLLPRDYAELRQFLGLAPRPLYLTFFQIALTAMGIRVNEFLRDNLCALVEERIKRHILSGYSLQDIYENTCVIKTTIKRVVDKLLPDGYDVEDYYDEKNNKLEIEKTLFGIKDCHYQCDVSFADFQNITGSDICPTFDFAVYRQDYLQDQLLFLIDRLDEECFEYMCSDDASKQRCAAARQVMKAKDEYAYIKDIPILKISFLAFIEGDVWDILRDAFEHPSAIAYQNLRQEADRIYYRLFDEDVPDMPHSPTIAESARQAGCYNCGYVFEPKITKRDNSFVCPHCGGKTVIFDSQGFRDITKSVMRILSRRYRQSIGSLEKAYQEDAEPDRKPLEDEYIFLSVVFNSGGRSYYYLTDDNTICVGDDVLVPVGSSRECVVTVVNKEYFKQYDAPMAIETVKSIISKVE